MSIFRLLLGCLFLSISLFETNCQEYLVNTDPEGETLRLTAKTMRVGEDTSYDVRVPITLEDIGGISFLNFVNPIDGFPWIPRGPVRLLALYDRGYLILYSSHSVEPVFLGSSDKILQDGQNFNYSATSYLVEGNTTYVSDNLGKVSLHIPWVEGKEGSGIGEKIFISSKDQKLEISGFYFSNGFVSYSKPNLYKENNRVKSIFVRSSTGQDFGKFELKDTPELQFVYFGDKLHASSIEITILDVYHGTKYDDTCVNFIQPDAWYYDN